MKVYQEMIIDRNFPFWSGACETINLLTDEEIVIFADVLEEVSPEGMSMTEINDFFWFDTEFIAECLGYKDFEEMRTLRG